MAREAFLFGEAAALLRVNVPTLVDAGPGWILMEDVGGEPAAPDDVAPLEHLAPMHELFIGATGIEHERFRRRRSAVSVKGSSRRRVGLRTPPRSPSRSHRCWTIRRRWTRSSPRSRGRSCTVTRGRGTC